MTRDALSIHDDWCDGFGGSLASIAEPLTPEEEAQWRSWLASGHMPGGLGSAEAHRIARLLATLDATRTLADEGLAGLDVERLAKRLCETQEWCDGTCPEVEGEVAIHGKHATIVLAALAKVPHG